MAQIFTRVMFNWTTASTSLTQMNAGTTAAAGNYSPPVNGRLIKLSLYHTPQAASSLSEAGRFEMLQENWLPVNRLEFAFSGFGLQTVSTGPVLGTIEEFDYTVDLPVRTDWPINGQVIYFDSPVTPRLTVLGYFAA